MIDLGGVMPEMNGDFAMKLTIYLTSQTPKILFLKCLPLYIRER